MKILLTSSILKAALQDGELCIEDYSIDQLIKKEERALDSSIAPIFVDGSPDEPPLPKEEDSEDSTEDMNEKVLNPILKQVKEVIKKERNIMKKMEFRCVESTTTETGRLYKLKGNDRINFGVQDIEVRAYDEDGTEIDVEDTIRAIGGRGRPAKYYSIEGVASSTSVDSYGTEMSYDALLGMQDQMQRGIPLLPRHSSRENGQMAEWDEVIGRTYEADIRQDAVSSPVDREDKQYILLVHSRLYGEDKISRELVKRLRRGEPIGQSIGGWFNDMEIQENTDGEIERVIIKSVILDHLAITRAPANPDSIGLATYNKDSTTLHNIINTWRSDMETETSKRLEEQSNKLQEEETEDLTEQISSGLREDLTELSKSTHLEDLEDRSISSVTETDTKVVVEFDKKVNDEERAEEVLLSLLNSESIKSKVDVMLDVMLEKRLKDIEEQNKMKFDSLADSVYSDDEEVVEKRDLDSSSVVDQPEVIPVDNGGQDEPAVETEYEENSPFDKIVRSVMPFQDDLAIAEEDVPWEWDTTTADEVLGVGLDNWRRYAMAHLYYDKDEDPEKKSTYKLPIARMLNGELMVIFKGCVAAIGALNGARGGIDISDEDREDCYKVLSQYYAKFGKDIPELRNIEENQKESQIIKNNVILSKETQKENSMTQDDMKSLAELIGRTVNDGMKPLTDRIDDLESRSIPTVVETKEVEEVKAESSEVEELRAIISKQNELIERALSEPQRQGIHSMGQLHRGIGATTAIEQLAERAAKAGYVSVSAIVNRHKDILSEETGMSKLSVHVLKDLLASGLRSAEQDGLLGSQDNQWS